MNLTYIYIIFNIFTLYHELYFNINTVNKNNEKVLKYL